eukprot:3567720-Amphidinium_carterae.1
MFCAVSKCITSATPQAVALGAAVGGMDSGRLNAMRPSLVSQHCANHQLRTNLGSGASCPA